MNIELKNKIADILNKQNFCVFTSIGKEFPHPTLIGFIANRELTQILFATSINTQKFENLIKNPKISLFFDNRMNNNEDISIATTISAQGIAKSFTSDQKKELDGEKLKMIDDYKKKHPNLINFINDINTAIVFVQIKKYQLVSRFEAIEEIIL